MPGRRKKEDMQWQLSDVDEDFPMPDLESYRLFTTSTRGERTYQVSARLPEDLVVLMDDLVAEGRMRGLKGLDTRADLVKVGMTYFVDALTDYIGQTDSQVVFFTRQKEIGRRSRDLAALAEIKRNVVMALQGWLMLCENREYRECCKVMSQWLHEAVLEEESGVMQRLYAKALKRNPIFDRIVGHMSKENLLSSEIDECLELIEGLTE